VTRGREVLAAAPVVGLLGVLTCESALRRGSARPSGTRRGGRLRRVAILYPLIVGAGFAIWWASGVVLFAVVVMLLAFLVMAQA